MPLKKIRLLWRDNPLKRGTDVAESWMFLTTAVLIAVTAPAAGVAAASALDTSSQRQGHEGKSVSAILTEDPPLASALIPRAAPAAGSTPRCAGRPRTAQYTQERRPWHQVCGRAIGPPHG